MSPRILNTQPSMFIHLLKKRSFATRFCSPVTKYCSCWNHGPSVTKNKLLNSTVLVYLLMHQFLLGKMYCEIQRTRSGQKGQPARGSTVDCSSTNSSCTGKLVPGTMQILSYPLKTEGIMEFCLLLSQKSEGWRGRSKCGRMC